MADFTPNFSGIAKALELISSQINDITGGDGGSSITEAEVKSAIETATNLDELETKLNSLQSTANSLAIGIGTTSELLSVQDSSIETNSRLGSLTETAPASDTASSGINGRLQRVAQRITSLIALLPSSLGQKTEANSFSVVQATAPSITSTVTVQTTGTLTATFAANSSRKAISINNPKSNTATVFVDVDPNTNFSSTNHMFSLEPGDTFYDDTVLARSQFLLLASAASTTITIRSFV